jgi:hypothetical protein
MTDLEILVKQTSNSAILKMQQRLHAEVVELGKKALQWKEGCHALALALETERDAANLYAKQVAHWIEKHDEVKDSLDFYKRRVEALQQWQSKMRDPERTVVCDILANGHTLEPAGDRYATPLAAPDLQAELDATNKQVEILSDALAESRREVAARRKPLNDAQLLYAYNSLPSWDWDLERLSPHLKKFARAIEAAHGIKELNT